MTDPVRPAKKPERFKFVSAVHLILVRKNKVLLLRRYNTGYEDGNYSVIAGHLDGDEKVKSAMIREASEEAGITIQENNIEIIGVMHRMSSDERIDFFLKCEEWQGDISNMEPHKCDSLEWFNLDKLPNNVVPYVRKGIENYLSNKMFDSFGWQQ